MPGSSNPNLPASGPRSEVSEEIGWFRRGSVQYRHYSHISPLLEGPNDGTFWDNRMSFRRPNAVGCYLGTEVKPWPSHLQRAASFLNDSCFAMLKGHLKVVQANLEKYGRGRSTLASCSPAWQIAIFRLFMLGLCQVEATLPVFAGYLFDWLLQCHTPVTCFYSLPPEPPPRWSGSNCRWSFAGHTAYAITVHLRSSLTVAVKKSRSVMLSCGCASVAFS